VTLSANREGKGWHAKGVSSLSCFHGTPPTEEFEDRNVHVAVYSSQSSGASEVGDLLLQGSGSCEPRWVTGVGAWLIAGQSSTKGLRRIAEKGLSVEALRQADGAFAIMTGEPESGFCKIATDTLGALHIFGARTEDGCFHISTSSLALASLLRPDWDASALHHYFSYGSVFGHRSLFRGVSKLPAASILRIGPGGVTHTQRYWRMEEHCFDRRSASGDALELSDTLRRSIKAIAASSRRPVLDLTGGFDSRAVFGAALQEGLQLQTTTVGDSNDPDVVTARRITDEFGYPHIRRERFDMGTEEYWGLCQRSLTLLDGEGDIFLYAGALRTHLASSQDFDASINGSVGEICKGQWWEAMLPFIGRRGAWEEDTRKISLRRFAVHDVPRGLLRPDALPAHSLGEEFTNLVREATRDVRDLPNTATVDLAYLRMRMQHWQGRYTSATLRLWPCWSPFAFREVLELALSSPPKSRIRHRLIRRLIETQSHKLAALPLAQGYPALPVRWDTCHRFYPLAREIAGKVVRKVSRQVGFGGKGSLMPAIGSSPASQISRLWELEEVAAMLQPPAMHTRDLYQTVELQRVLIASRNPANAAECEAAGRILTLEMVARQIRTAAGVVPET
jgi:asparagine synthase (glutamine-hydrolysing)